MSTELRKYLKHFDCLEKHHGILYCKFFNDNGRNFICQHVVPKHLRNEVLYRVHNSKYAGHPGIAKTAELVRKLLNFPGFFEFSANNVKNCSCCLQIKPVEHQTLKTPLSFLATDKYYPVDMLQVDLVGKLPDSASYNHKLTANDTFSKYLFATPLPNASATKVAKQLFYILMRPAYIPKVVLSDQGTAFTSRVMTELSHCKTSTTC